jgi:hypothetical protein
MTCGKGRALCGYVDRFLVRRNALTCIDGAVAANPVDAKLCGSTWEAENFHMPEKST